MKTTINITVRAFPVRLQDTRSGTITQDTVVLTKQQLQAAQVVGEGSKELILPVFLFEGNSSWFLTGV